MYVMAVLCMVKLYQTRHPDINATAYATFGVLAVAILLGNILLQNERMSYNFYEKQIRQSCVSIYKHNMLT